MPGRPRLTQFCRQIEEEGGDDVILDRIADGESIKSIMKGYGFISRRVFYDWLKEGGAERKAAYQEARKISAGAYVDEATEILEDPKAMLDNASARNAEARAKHKTWLASKYDKETFGEEKANLNLNLSLGDLYHSVLQAKGFKPHAEVEEADYELLASGPDEDGGEGAPAAAPAEVAGDPVDPLSKLRGNS